MDPETREAPIWGPQQPPVPPVGTGRHSREEPSTSPIERPVDPFTPQGWTPDSDRWRPPGAPAWGTAEPAGPVAGSRLPQPLWRKWWVWVLGCFVVLVIIGNVLGRPPEATVAPGVSSCQTVAPPTGG